ncbi:MAG: hypothetical protein NXI27_17150 [Alphaproteobacteria bacterium]|nr:hypothetical protein [Alphaproteobacteria bacterium]
MIGAAIVLLGTTGQAVSAEECPAGYRLHYQGFCIHQADEQADDPDKGVRTVLPSNLLDEDRTSIFARLATTGYKFSNMEDGEYCKTAYVRMSRGEVQQPVAFALGEQSCGFSNASHDVLEDAIRHAMSECEKNTENCRIIVPEER